MTTKKRIAIDIDDVLAAHASSFVDFSNKRWGTNLTVKDYDEDWAKMWQFDRQNKHHANEVERRALAYITTTTRSLPHNETALAVLSQLREDFTLLIVTSRRLLVKGDTLDWVHERFPGIFENNEIYFAGIWDSPDHTSISKTKKDILIEKKADYLIDDQPKHCNAAVAEGLGAILFGAYPWQAVETVDVRVVKAANWADIGVYFNAERARISHTS